MAKELASQSKDLKVVQATFDLIMRYGFKKVTMSDIAEALDVSRPTLYSSFSNKEEILNALIDKQIVQYEADTAKFLASKRTLKKKLEGLFDIWILKPFASVIDSEHGKDMLLNIGTYAPAGCNKIYTHFEEHLTSALKFETKKVRDLPPRNAAHILMLATRGLKSSTKTLAELERMVEGLIAMTVSSFEK